MVQRQKLPEQEHTRIRYPTFFIFTESIFRSIILAGRAYWRRRQEIFGVLDARVFCIDIPSLYGGADSRENIRLALGTDDGK